MMAATEARLSSAPNFRDMAGVQCLDRRALKSGMLFRSDRLSELSSADFGLLKKWGIRTVIDLRSASERSASKTVWPLGFSPTVHEWDVHADIRSGHASVLEPLRDEPTAVGAERLMTNTYKMLPQALLPYLSSYFNYLADPDMRPILFHCSAGKDRTGFLAAITLTALGAEQDAVMRDYMITQERLPMAKIRDQVRQALHSSLEVEPSDEIVEALVETRPQYLISALEEIRLRWGLIDNYFAEAQVDPGLLAKLGHDLLEDEPVPI